MAWRRRSSDVDAGGRPMRARIVGVWHAGTAPDGKDGFTAMLLPFPPLARS
jgi:hypothetical protein